MGEKLGALVFLFGLGAIGFGLTQWVDGWPAWIGGAMIIFAVLGIFRLFQPERVPPRDVFCADCGQYLGPSSGF